MEARGASLQENHGSYSDVSRQPKSSADLQCAKEKSVLRNKVLTFAVEEIWAYFAPLHKSGRVHNFHLHGFQSRCLWSPIVGWMLGLF